MLDDLTSWTRERSGGLLLVLLILVIVLYVWVIVITGVFGAKEKFGTVDWFHKTGASGGARNRWMTTGSHTGFNAYEHDRHAPSERVGDPHGHGARWDHTLPGIVRAHPMGRQAVNRSRARERFTGQTADAGARFDGPDFTGEQHKMWARRAYQPDGLTAEFDREHEQSYYPDHAQSGGASTADIHHPEVSGDVAAAKTGAGSAHLTEAHLATILG